MLNMQPICLEGWIEAHLTDFQNSDCMSFFFRLCCLNLTLKNQDGTINRHKFDI